MYSYRIEQAIRAASILHKDQLRKGSMPIPHITHLMAVAMITADYTDDEDTIITALLHDTLEDTDYTTTELQEDFGGKVRELVEALSEPKSTKEKKVTAEEKKKAYIKQLKNAPEEAVIVAAADKLHNMRAIVEEYYDNHDGFVADFGKNLDDRIVAYQAISNVINSRLKNAIIHEFNHVFTEYKNFILDVKKTRENDGF